MTTTGEILTRSTQMSTGDIIRSQIASLYFLDYGTVDSIVDETHIAVKLWYQTGEKKDVVLEDVELLCLGSSSVHITIAPKKGDIVALFGSRRPVAVLDTTDKKEGVCSSTLSYTLSTVKALQIYTPSEATPIIDIAVSDTCDVTITADVNLKIDGNCNSEVTGDAILKVSGKTEATLEGATKISVTGTVTLKATDSVTINDHLEIKV